MELSSSEIKDVKDLEAGTIATCCICFQSNGEKDEGLISPCMCKDTQQFVHRSCLDHWRSVKQGFDFSHCATCKAQFHLRVELKGSVWVKTKLGLFVARDVILVFLALQTVIGMLGVLSYLVDKHGYLKDLFNDYWDRILSRHPIPIYYGIGAFAFFVLLGLFVLIQGSCIDDDGRVGFCVGRPTSSSCFELDLVLLICVICIVLSGIFGILSSIIAATIIMQGIWQSHNHILAMKELTKEYVVEDLGSYSPAELDPEHVERLKVLVLFTRLRQFLTQLLCKKLLDYLSHENTDY